MRPTRPLRLALDGALAAVALVVSLGAMSHGGWDREELAADGRDLDGVGVGLALLMTVPLVGRRIAPLPVFAVVTLATGTLYGLGYAFPPVAFAIALFTAARRPAGIEPRLHTAVLAASLVVLVGPSLVRNGFGPELLFGTLVWGGAWFAGDRLRQRGARIAAEAEQARRAEREAERERRLASAEERTRIARDLHDSAGHAVSVILVQAGAARLLLEQDPARSRAAIETIEEVARDTLAEIDQLVRALREEGASNGVEPPAGLAALDTLLARSRAAGLEPSVAVEGERRALAPARRPGRVPHPPRGADERRAPRHRHRLRHARLRAVGTRDHRREPARRRGARGCGPRPRRDARACLARRRHARGGRARRQVPRPRDAPVP